MWIEYDDDTATFAAWPVDKFGARLPADQIARGVRLGLSLWASVLPDMRFRFAARPEEANLAFRFGDYRLSGFGDGGGRAFLPHQWDSLDLDCGRLRENRRPDGSACEEWSHNLITLQRGRWAVKAVDFMDNAAVHDYFVWVFDAKRPHFRLAGGPCRPDTSGAAWDQGCVEFPRSPHYAALRGSDLVVVVQHEFGHALVGNHTPSPGEYVDFARRPILDPERCLRRAPDGYSVMMPGDGAASWWNGRAVSRHDADRLSGMGYRVSYPGSDAGIVLARPGAGTAGPGGAPNEVARIVTRTVSNWDAAQRALLWPLQGRPLSPEMAARQLFLVDVRLPARAGGR